MQKLILKIGAFCGVVVLLQYVYFHQASKMFSSIKPPSRMLNLVEKELATDFDAVYIGSSINFNKSRKDRDRRDIVEMINGHLENCNVLDVSRGGNNVELYDDIIKYINKRKKEELQYVIELSIRTFSPIYDEPANARSLKQDEILFKDNLLSAFYHPLKVFNYDFNVLTSTEFDKSLIYDGDNYIGNLGDILTAKEASKNTEEVAAKKFFLNYMGHIQEDNPKIEALNYLLQYLKSSNKESFFVIMPENVEQGEVYHPKTFLERYKRNTNYVKNIIEKSGFRVLDLSTDLDSSYFTHALIFPNGHLDDRGRQYVGRSISKLIKCN